MSDFKLTGLPRQTSGKKAVEVFLLQIIYLLTVAIKETKGELMQATGFNVNVLNQFLCAGLKKGDMKTLNHFDFILGNIKGPQVSKPCARAFIYRFKAAHNPYFWDYKYIASVCDPN